MDYPSGVIEVPEIDVGIPEQADHGTDTSRNSAEFTQVGIYLKNTREFPLLNRREERSEAIAIEKAQIGMLSLALKIPLAVKELSHIRDQVLSGDFPLDELLCNIKGADRSALEAMGAKFCSLVSKVISSEGVRSNCASKLISLTGFNTSAYGPLFDALERTTASMEGLQNSIEGASDKATEKRLREELRVCEKAAGIKYRKLKKISKEIAQRRQQLYQHRDTMANSNLRLVINIAKHYVGRGVPFPDLIQEGNVGLMNAIDRFKYQKGYKFSTFATWWIRQSIARGVADKSRTIRLPIHMFDRVVKVAKVREMLEMEMSGPVTDEYLAERCGLTLGNVEECLRLSSAAYELTYDSPISGETDLTFQDVIEDETSPAPDAVAEENETRRRLIAFLDVLTPKERFVVMARTGFLPRFDTLDSIGKRLDVTRERVRQIQNKAIKKLKDHPMAECIRKEILDDLMRAA
jgi:RNA polymerase sigma factor (sigma-70 family)